MRIASPAEVVDAFGSKPGSLSPLCLQCGDGTASEVVGTVLVDTALADYDQVAFGAGDERSFMVTDLATLLMVLGTEVRESVYTLMSGVTHAAVWLPGQACPRIQAYHCKQCTSNQRGRHRRHQ